MQEIKEIIERDVAVNLDAFESGDELTAKLTIRGRLISEAIYPTPLLADKQFLIAYLQEIVRDYHCGSLTLEDGDGI